MKRFGFLLRLTTVLVVLSLISCQLPKGDNTPYSERPPENPDPLADHDPADTDYVDIGHTIYANVNNEIRAFESDEPDLYIVVAENLDPDNPQFCITTDGDYAVFTREIGSVSASNKVIIVRNISTKAETELDKINDDLSLLNDFDVTGHTVVYSDNGHLSSYDIDTGNPPVIINSDDDSNVCNHFPRIFDGDTITFAVQVPSEIYGTIKVIPYDGTPQPPGYSDPYPGGSQVFGTLFHPTILSGGSSNGLIYLASPYSGDTVYFCPDHSGQSLDPVHVQCSETSSVQFNDIYRTKSGNIVFFYGFGSVYWFPDNGTITAGFFNVSGREFSEPIRLIRSSPDDAYVVIQDDHGIWVYDSSMNQLNCSFSWLNQLDEVLWIDVS